MRLSWRLKTSSSGLREKEKEAGETEAKVPNDLGTEKGVVIETGIKELLGNETECSCKPLEIRENSTMKS